MTLEKDVSRKCGHSYMAHFRNTSQGPYAENQGGGPGRSGNSPWLVTVEGLTCEKKRAALQCLARTRETRGICAYEISPGFEKTSWGGRPLEQGVLATMIEVHGAT